MMQGGTPEDIYRQPVNDFVAGFIGKSNIPLRSGCEFREWNGSCFRKRTRPIMVATREEIPSGTDVWLSLRPQYLRLGDSASDAVNNVSGTINYLEYLGGLVKGEDSGV